MTPGPALFNACDYLLDRHIREGRGDRLALTGPAGDVSYAELAERVTHAARGLRGHLRVLGEDGLEVPPGMPGTLFVRGASAAIGYWSRYDASRQVFQGEWLPSPAPVVPL